MLLLKLHDIVLFIHITAMHRSYTVGIAPSIVYYQPSNITLVTIPDSQLFILTL